MAAASNINFDTLQDHVVPMNEWRLEWRFTEDKYDNLPDLHLSQILPLDKQAAAYLWELTLCNIHGDFPFVKNRFCSLEHMVMEDDCQDDKPVKKWLFERGIPFQETIYLSWEPQTAAITNWKILVKYWSAFFYPFDELTVVDKSSSWSLLFHHEEHISSVQIACVTRSRS